MAGQGPPPKDPGERRRRNKDEPLEPLPAEGYTGDYPALPATYGFTVMKKVKTGDGDEELVSETKKVTFLKGTREWYDTWARSPMATEFTNVDWNRLQRLAKLVDQFERKPTKDMMAEIRLQEAAFGGTPMDRRRLGKKIGGEGSKARRRRPSSEKEAQERRSRLRAAG